MSDASPNNATLKDPRTHTLHDLKPGESGVVVQLHSEGAERRRMLDLGILPGTRIEAWMNSPLGDPTAYRIRGFVVALRKEQAQQIEIRRIDPTESTRDDLNR